MASPLLALLARSMRVESRLKPTYIARGTLVLVVAVFLVARVLAAGWTGAPGLAAFESIVLIQFVFITLAGLGYFSSAITEEKEEETLGLLRMTDLNPISILLGKSTSRLIGVLLALLVQLPFTFLAATLGGVSTHQVLACYLALGGYTFFLANLALLASVRASRTGFAAIGVGIALLLLASGRGLSGFLFKTVTLPEQAESVRGLLTFARETLVASSTLARLEQILATGFTGSLASPQLIFDLVAGFACFVCAWVNFERHCGGTIGGGRALIPLYAWSRKRFPPGRPWTRALVWKDAYFVHGGTAVMWAKFVGYGLCLLVLAAGRVVLSPISGFGSISSLAFEGGALCVAVLVLEIGFAGSRMVAAEVREKALSSLAMLPINLPRLYAAKVSACYHAALPAAT
ncbi:MAG TPA: hypothetical protein VGO90_15415, partial [Chthoniobacteraceae bacterium]|nr:hypothetical protein [Chthoniobacteraceae bacterium]